MDDQARLADKLFSHCCQAGNPVGVLSQTGSLPKNWASKYLSLLEKSKNTWSRSDMLPRKVASAVHYASMHVCSYYDLWSSLNGKHNESTKAALREIRAQSEVFLFADVSETEPGEVGPADT